MFSFLVCEFGKLTISNLVKESFGSEFPEILSKQQVDYVYRYLNDLGAKSVVLEAEYIDRDYLDDFAKFYVKRFNGRGHKCARLHAHSFMVSIHVEGAVGDDSGWVMDFSDIKTAQPNIIVFVL